jgi:hypothetical protein
MLVALHNNFQALKYGSREDYKKYVKNTPMLIPFGAGDDVDELVQSAQVMHKPAFMSIKYFPGCLELCVSTYMSYYMLHISQRQETLV